eukprot:357027-Chlamydomonas_euryale.AAC.2
MDVQHAYEIQGMQGRAHAADEADSPQGPSNNLASSILQSAGTFKSTCLAYRTPSSTTLAGTIPAGNTLANKNIENYKKANADSTLAARAALKRRTRRHSDDGEERERERTRRHSDDGEERERECVPMPAPNPLSRAQTAATVIFLPCPPPCNSPCCVGAEPPPPPSLGQSAAPLSSLSPPFDSSDSQRSGTNASASSPYTSARRSMAA